MNLEYRLTEGYFLPISHTCTLVLALARFDAISPYTLRRPERVIFEGGRFSRDRLAHILVFSQT